MKVSDNIEILLVEDNESDADLTIRALRKRNLANNLLWVQDGAEALSFMFHTDKYADRKGTEHPKVILLDLKLPKVNGLDVLKQLRENKTTQTIPIVIFTSSNEDPDIAIAYALGANSYVVKPINFDSFSQTMSDLGFYWLMINKFPM